MATSSISSHPSRLPTTQEILRVWRADRCLAERSAKHYLQWVGRLRRYFAECGLDERIELTQDGAQRFLAWYTRDRLIGAGHRGGISSAMKALRRVYEVLGQAVPLWHSTARREPPPSALLRAYATHLTQHRGNPEVTVLKKLDHVRKLLVHLADSRKTWLQLRLPDIDKFLIECAGRYARSTTADIASTVRSFARFLLASGRIKVDLAASVISPVQPKFERPRRALPWDEVRRLLNAVDTATACGLRDHALLLMMSTYGFGAGEVIGLQLQDIDWEAATLKVTRPKTRTTFVLPMLPAVAKVLARYLRHGRPPRTPTRHVFVQMKVPFGALTASSAVRHILIKHAKAAGIDAPYLGSHVLRHSNAARQIDTGMPARVLSDLLGHRDPESVSAYVRIATQSLRDVSLPVPR
ncbi:phage integrase family protein [mine drainage metagenome]|uniref:Phage integrase family protein n=2 Tax=mine drainage metagenome TaxID=410659 RepID=T1A9C6_9ZZZZ